MMKAAAVLAWITGLGFGLLCPYAIWYLVDRGEVWTFLGFPTYGEGPFEDIGIETTVPLLVLFLLVCAAETAAGWLLWRHRRAGAVLALALLPLEFAFWIGFALPYGPPVGSHGRCWCCWAGLRCAGGGPGQRAAPHIHPCHEPAAARLNKHRFGSASQ